jgi:hypothetical protein
MEMRSINNLDGCKARLTTRYAKLCCEDQQGTDDAFSAAWTGVVTFAASGSSSSSSSSAGLSTPKWAQTGFTRRRNAGSAAIIQYRKAEAQGDTYHHTFDTANAPAEGSTHDYQVQLDKTTGKWTFTYDGADWETYTDNFWTSHFGTRVDYGGETLTLQDDMSGTDANKCAFTNCQFKTDGQGYQDAATDTSTNDDPTKFGLERVSDTAVNIWDKNPH